MNILLVENLSFLPYLQAEGHNVLTASYSNSSDFPIQNSDFKLSKICNENSIDVLLQVENLSNRIVITDLEQIKILKIYYAVDIHLNYYWQRDYALLFDIFISSQKNFSELHEQKTGQKSFWLPWGVDANTAFTFKPFNERKYDIAFVGIVDENRLKRACIIDEIKKKYNIHIAGNTIENRIPYNEIFKIYNNSKIVLNESINNEVNFRYFEATFAGALLFTEEINNGEDVIFKKDEEIVTFNNENFIEKLDYLMANENIAEKIAFKGWEKSVKHHTLKERVINILKTVKELRKNQYVFVNEEDCLHKIIFLQYLRGISDKRYISILQKLIEKSKGDIFSILAEFYLIKIKSVKLSVEFLENICRKGYKHELILLNLTTSRLEAGYGFDKNNLFSELLKKIPMMIKAGAGYLQGFINVRKATVILSGFDIVTFLYKYFPYEARYNKTLNLLAGKILISANNYQGAIHYLLHNARYYPCDILTRKYLETCYYQIYKLDLFYIEKLKVFIIEREFRNFREFDCNVEFKKIAVLDMIEHCNDKSLIRDISFQLHDFLI